MCSIPHVSAAECAAHFRPVADDVNLVLFAAGRWSDGPPIPAPRVAHPVPPAAQGVIQDLGFRAYTQSVQSTIMLP